MKINLETIKKSFIKIVAFTFSIFLLLGSNMAIAAKIPTPPLTAQISGGTFSVDTKEVDNPLKQKVVVRSAILSLPSNQTGTIDGIIINAPTTAQPDGGIVFGCVNTKVKDGIDLIKACGGPAELLPGGKLRYQAKGSGFDPDENITLKVELYDDF